MRRGEHAAEDASFARSTRSAALRGAALIIVAVLLGWVLLRATDSPDPLLTTGTTVEEAGEAEDEGAATTTTAAGTDTTAAPGTDTTAAPAGPRPAGEVQVVVANGAGVAGAAGRITEELRPAGWNLLDPTNATVTDAEESVVYFAPGYEAEAQALAGSLDPAATVQPLPDPVPVRNGIGEANLLLLVGQDLAGG